MIGRSSCEFIPVRCAQRSPATGDDRYNSAVSDGRSASGVLEGESDGFDSLGIPVSTRVPGWGTIRAGNYGAAVGDPRRWPGASQLYRASGLSPAQHESAGKRRDGSISREGSVALRRALIDLGIGLWRSDPAARRYGQQLRARGKKGGVIGCAMAHRANKIAYARVRDQIGYDPGAGPDRSRGFLDRCPFCRAQQRSPWSARSAARTNEVDRGKQRRTIGRRGSPPGKEQIWPFHNQACR